MIATHLTELIKTHAPELLGRQETSALMDNVKQHYPVVVDELVPGLLTVGEVQRVLQNLLRERIPIRNLLLILENLADGARQSKDIDFLTERVRAAMARHISAEYTENGLLSVITVDPRLETLLGEAARRGEDAYALLDPATVGKIYASLTKQIQLAQQAGHSPSCLLLRKRVCAQAPHRTRRPAACRSLVQRDRFRSSCRVDRSDLDDRRLCGDGRSLRNGSTLQLLGFRPRQSVSQLREKLPGLHRLHRMHRSGTARGQKVCFEGLGPSHHDDRARRDATRSERDVLVYERLGKYTFTTAVSSVNALATLEVPDEVKALQVFAGARQRKPGARRYHGQRAVALTALGKIKTDFQKGLLSDLSRGGAQLTVDRELKAGAKVDVQVPLDPAGPPSLVQGEVRRVDKTKTGKFNAGLRFLDLKPDVDQAISGFIARRQRDLRSRGLA